jgi:broad specificity phosphatase PhoE
MKEDYSIRDPSITELGRQQCAELRKALMKDPLAQQAELIITSPMRRTIQTALDTVDWLIEKGVKIEADANWQGMTQRVSVNDRQSLHGLSQGFENELTPSYRKHRQAM